MQKPATYTDELRKFKEYLRSDSNEDAKRPLLYPLFKKLFGDKLKIESDACGADVYVEGKIIVEAKTDSADWLEAFYQALHYHKKFGLAYSMIIVIAHQFIAIWKANKMPEYAVILAFKSDASIAPNKTGKENARKTSNAIKKEIQQAAIYWLEPKDLSGNFFNGEGKSLAFEIFEILNILKNTDTERIQINTHNFIQAIEYFKKFFEDPIDAIHCFYATVAYWDITSTVATNDYMDTFQVIGFKGHKLSEQIAINPKYFAELKKYIENHYIFTNEGSGLTIDYYFSRFDEALAAIDPDYVKQHGIFFTDSNLSKFALWFASQKLTEKISEDYIVFDPAAGSGNLIANWRLKLKHKIASELQYDLLRTIERRMRIDPWHIESGFTIIPKTSERSGLNFIDKSAEEYISLIEKELNEKNLSLDKPLAFILNPPYKNTDENEEMRDETESNYQIHDSIIQTTGYDAVKERYLAFLGQILNICKLKYSASHANSQMVMIFTPTSWLIPRPTYDEFRKTWDSYFEYIGGFITTSNEFFKISGKWPLGFTIWKYNYNAERQNHIKIFDYTNLKKNDIYIDWEEPVEEITKYLDTVLVSAKKIVFDNSRGDIRDKLPEIKKGKRQTMYDFKRDATKTELTSHKIYGGLPLKDERRNNKKTYGIENSVNIGFLDNCSPVRIKPKDDIRFEKKSHECLWFIMPNAFLHINYTKVHNGAPDKYGYCAYDFKTAQSLCTWFALTKVFNGKYPVWANQYNVWQPKIKKKSAGYFHALCFAFVLAENRCVVTKFEKDNPVKGAPEVFVDNPLCPTNAESFWATTLDSEIIPEHEIAYNLVQKIKELYKTWNLKYCKSQFLFNVGLKDEPYFKYFDYKDFLTPYSGLIQIKKYAQQLGLADLEKLFDEISELTKLVKDEINNLLINEYGYFD